MKSLNVALFAIGVSGLVGTSLAETRYYDPTNTAASQGKTTGYELYKTIGCPGKQLLDPACKEEVKPVPVAKPAPAIAPKCPLPAGAIPGDKLPMNAQPGQCFAKVVKTATFTTKPVRMLVKEASEKIEIVPAKYETVKERVLVKEASTRLEEVPAVYETVEEKILVKSATKKAISVPAVYETVTEKKLVRDAYTTWKAGTETSIQKLDDKTGQIMCLVEVPAEYQFVTRQVLKSPAAVRYEDEPAEYMTVKKTVLKTPASTRTVQIPAEYAEREVTRLASAAREVRAPIQAEYAEVPQEIMACPAQEYWTQILCDVNATPDKIMQIQKALQAAGFNPGALDGTLGSQTMAAVLSYQQAKGLPQDGYLNAETVKALGVTLK